MALLFFHLWLMELYWWESLKHYGEEMISVPQVKQKRSASVSDFVVSLRSLSSVLHSQILKSVYFALGLFQGRFRAPLVAQSWFLTLLILVCSVKSWESVLSWEHCKR